MTNSPLKRGHLLVLLQYACVLSCECVDVFTFVISFKFLIYFVSNNMSFDGSGHLAEASCKSFTYVDSQDIWILLLLNYTSKFIPTEIYHLCWKPLHCLGSCVIVELSTRGQACRISMQQPESKQQILFRLLTSWLKLLYVILTLPPRGENK